MNRENLFGDAYEKGFRKTTAVLRRRGANPDLADELAQAAWVRAWERMETLRDDQRIVAWVISIAHNLLRDHLSQSRRMTDLASAAADPKTSPAVNEALIDLQFALRRCPQRQRELLETVYLQSDARSTAVIANDLGTSVGGLHHRVSRARRALRAALQA